MKVQQIYRTYPIKVPSFLVVTNGAYIMMFNAIKAICKKAPETPETDHLLSISQQSLQLLDFIHCYTYKGINLIFSNIFLL